MVSTLTHKPYNENGLYNPLYINKNQLTNCVLEIPQRIKYEINNAGRLVLKAGSKVYVSETGTFDTVTLNTDTPEGGGGEWTTAHNRSLFAVYVPESNKIINADFDHTFVQNVAPTSFLSNRALWFDTVNNVVKITEDSGASWQICSLPIMTGRPGETNIGWRGYVDEVFNGAGFIGSIVWISEGLKVLISAGHNSDGTFKNKEYTVDKLYMNNETGKNSVHFFLNLQNPNRINTWGASYQVGKNASLLENTSLMFLNENTNYVERYNPTGELGQAGNQVYLGRLFKSSNTGHITSMTLERCKLFNTYDVQTIDEPDLSAPTSIPYNTEFLVKEPGWVYFNTHLRTTTNYTAPSSAIQVYGKLIDKDSVVSVYGNLCVAEWDGKANTVAVDNMATLFVRVYPAQRVKLHTQNSTGSASVVSNQCIFYPLKRKGQ